MSSVLHLYKKRAFRLYKIDIAISERLYDTQEIFKQQFGEDHVDFDIFEGDEGKKQELQYFCNQLSVKYDFDQYCTNPNHNIVVKVDKETVKNELGLSTIIYDLFIRIQFRRNGTMLYGIEYKRATFTKNQLLSNYVHSHCPRLYASDGIKWGHVCTGSGPINNSLSALSSIDTPLERLYGFIAELRQIVKVESLQGGPYIKIEEINGVLKEVKYVEACKPAFTTKPKALIRSYIRSNRLKLGLINGQFCLGCSFVEWLIDFTEYAKAWSTANVLPIRLSDVIIKNNRLYAKNSERSDEYALRLIGKPVIKFKGTPYLLKLIEDGSAEQVKQLVSPKEAASILYSILSTLNTYYGTE
jgi:hypothetical protein